VHETAVGIESAFQHDGVQVRVEPYELPCGGIGDDRRAVELAAGCGVVERADHRVDLTGDFPVKGTVVAEEAAQDLGKDEEQDGQRWKTLQLKGRKTSARQPWLAVKSLKWVRNSLCSELAPRCR